MDYYEYMNQVDEARSTVSELYRAMAFDVNDVLDDIDELSVKISKLLNVHNAQYDELEPIWEPIKAPDLHDDLEMTDEEFDEANSAWTDLVNKLYQLHEVHNDIRYIQRKIDAIDTDRYTDEI